MTKCRYLVVFSALVFLTVGGTATVYADTSAKFPQRNCPPVGEACAEAHTPTCHYEFTVKKDNGSASFDVQYSPYVFANIEPKMYDKKEKEYVKVVRGKKYTISVRPGQAVEIGKTYLFTKCPDSIYDRGPEVDPNRLPPPDEPKP